MTLEKVINTSESVGAIILQRKQVIRARTFFEQKSPQGWKRWGNLLKRIAIKTTKVLVNFSAHYDFIVFLSLFMGGENGEEMKDGKVFGKMLTFSKRNFFSMMKKNSRCGSRKWTFHMKNERWKIFIKLHFNYETFLRLFFVFFIVMQHRHPQRRNTCVIIKLELDLSVRSQN